MAKATADAHKLALVGSEALDCEVSRVADVTRRTETQAMLALASEPLKVDGESAMLASTFEKQGVRAMDALHLALPSMARVDCFGACDDKLFRQAKILADLKCPVSDLLDLISELTQ